MVPFSTFALHICHISSLFCGLAISFTSEGTMLMPYGALRWVGHLLVLRADVGVWCRGGECPGVTALRSVFGR